MRKYSDKEKIIAASAGGFALLLMLSAVFSRDFALSANLVFLGTIVLIVPYAAYSFFAFKKIRIYEEEFPVFLRDLAEAQRAGLSIMQSIRLVSKSNYGSLTPHVQKMALQLSWNVPLEKVFGSFTERVSGSPLIVRSMMVIEQVNKSGEKVEDIMDSLANNIELLKDVEDEKAALLNQQVLMLYAIFFIFVGISLALVKFLIPLVESRLAPSTTSSVNTGLSSYSSFLPTQNPCEKCVGSGVPACFGCSTFGSVSLAFGFGDPKEASSYYKSLFFVMVAIQAIFSGLIAGQIGSDSVAAGVKHSVIMFIFGVFIYLIVVRLGLV
ncbi:MAG: type II secretion system F family protein [Candidatus Aenigmarchaeota archaeon]|nr:type II secretion system F family protein [Candidatus Aenigmarchaeota archaeon]